MNNECIDQELDRCLYSTEIADIRPYKEPLKTEAGVIWYDQVTMDDGTLYRTKTGVPNNLVNDIAVDFTSAWGTSEEGHNHRTLLRIMEGGSIGRLLGPERYPWRYNAFDPIGSVEALQRLYHKANEIDLGESAHNYLTIADGLDEYYDRDPSRGKVPNPLPGVSVVYGESRGAMIAFGLFAQAESHSREIVYGDIIDPCIEHPPARGEWLNVPRLAAEAGAIGRIVVMVCLDGRVKHYPKTIDPSIDYLIPAIGTRKTLFSGRAGELARQVPKDAKLHITFFNSSLMNHAKEYKEIFSSYDGVYVDEPKGGHLTIPERKILLDSLARISILETEMHSHDNDSDVIDFSEVYTAKRQKPLTQIAS